LLASRLQERRLNTQYVSQYFIPYRMTPDRMQQVDELLRPLPTTPVNHDFAPVAYSFDVVLWSAQFGHAYSEWFRSVSQFAYRSVFSVLVLVLLMRRYLLSLFPAPKTGRARQRHAARPPRALL
jgi:hypothetical protein